MTSDNRLLLYVLVLVAVPLILAAIWWAWKFLLAHREHDSTLLRVTKNVLSPMTAQLLNKIIDMGYAILVLRILGPEGNGQWMFAISIWWYFSVISDFGLGTLVTREVAKDKSEGSRYLTNASIVRLSLALGSFLPIAAIVAGFTWMTELEPSVISTILLLTLGLLPSQPAGNLSALFYAYEKIEYPAAVTTVATVAKVAIGIPILLLGTGIVGLAAVSIVVNVLTLGLLFYLAKTRLFRARWEPDITLCRQMLTTAFPLMVNALLSSLFFRIDMIMLKPMQGDAVVGWYGAAYKFVDGLLIIPAAVTLALFPLMSNYAAASKEALMRTYTAGLRVLLAIAWPISAGTFFIAHSLIRFFAGDPYLPHSAVALQVLIWFLPFSYVNGLTQYLLIAINRQRLITLGFAMALPFNVVANLLLIPRYSYVAAAAITVATELVLFIPFYLSVLRSLGKPPIAECFIRPTVAAAAMCGCLWWLQDIHPLAIVGIGGLVYMGVLLVVGGLSRDELGKIRRLVLGRVGQ
jgi:O-antigen/teichoic acid export membrane protein